MRPNSTPCLASLPRASFDSLLLNGSQLAADSSSDPAIPDDGQSKNCKKIMPANVARNSTTRTPAPSKSFFGYLSTIHVSFWQHQSFKRLGMSNFKDSNSGHNR